MKKGEELGFNKDELFKRALSSLKEIADVETQAQTHSSITSPPKGDRLGRLPHNPVTQRKRMAHDWSEYLDLPNEAQVSNARALIRENSVDPIEEHTPV